MHFYSFIGIGVHLYVFQSKNNISFFYAHKHNCKYCSIQNFE